MNGQLVFVALAFIVGVPVIAWRLRVETKPLPVLVLRAMVYRKQMQSLTYQFTIAAQQLDEFKKSVVALGASLEVWGDRYE